MVNNLIQKVRQLFSWDVSSFFKTFWIGPLVICWAVDPDDDVIVHLSIGVYPDRENATWKWVIVNYWE